MPDTLTATGPVARILASDQPAAGISPDALRGLFRNHPSGVAVITAPSDRGPVAMTASSLFSVSVAPPLIVFSASALSSSTPALLAADTLVIHLIDAESHEIAVLGATSGIDRFADTDLWSTLPTGEPYFVGPHRRIRARVVNKVDAGAATLFVVQAIESWNDEPADDASPLVYHNRTWHTLSDGSRLA
ncbi:flavin reductase family protein [Microbacterium hominis]|nr:flavin reductase family protein [Microbacterium hominis]QOC30295.1 flavin reductase family protein [Microbacterium hominis]QYF99293.1 flavin reductase family protein [Microbacterium sp. PAMC21962]